MKGFVMILLVVFALSASTHAQSCGRGSASYFIVDESGLPIKVASVTIRVVSENQSWRMDDYPKPGWKLQTFKPVESFTAAFEIEKPTFDLLQSQRLDILNRKSTVDILAAEKNSVIDLPENDDATFASRTVEGCALMATAEVQAEGYETAYYISDFTCGCSKRYQLKLLRKRERCLPSKSEPPKLSVIVN